MFGNGFCLVYKKTVSFSIGHDESGIKSVVPYGVLRVYEAFESEVGSGFEGGL